MTSPPRPLRGSPPGGHTRRTGEAGSVGVTGMASSAASGFLLWQASPAMRSVGIH